MHITLERRDLKFSEMTRTNLRKRTQYRCHKKYSKIGPQFSGKIRYFFFDANIQMVHFNKHGLMTSSVDRSIHFCENQCSKAFKLKERRGGMEFLHVVTPLTRILHGRSLKV